MTTIRVKRKIKLTSPGGVAHHISPGAILKITEWGDRTLTVQVAGLGHGTVPYSDIYRPEPVDVPAILARIGQA